MGQLKSAERQDLIKIMYKINKVIKASLKLQSGEVNKEMNNYYFYYSTAELDGNVKLGRYVVKIPDKRKFFGRNPRLIPIKCLNQLNRLKPSLSSLLSEC